jgi:protein-S-isoprenylcysteine O-methyltransferase Ste14
MKKNILLSSIIVLGIIACIIFISDGPTYLITSIMALAIMGAIHRFRSRGMKITRWAKANPKKAQWIITGLQLAIMALGIIAGKNFKELGYNLPDTAAYVFSAIMFIGFLSVHFRPKRSIIAIPKEVNRHRLVYMGIALSSFAMAVFTGNRIADIFPNSPISHAIEAIDQALLPDESRLFAEPDDVGTERAHVKNFEQVLTNEVPAMVAFAALTINNKEESTPNDKEEIMPNGNEELTSSDEEEITPDSKEEITSNDEEEITPSTNLKKGKKANFRAEKKMKKLEKKKERLLHRIKKHRTALAAALTAGAVLSIILLVLLACAGACLVVGGIALIADGSFGGILAILAGIGLGWLSIRQIGKVSKRDREKAKAQEKAKTDP